MATLRYLVAIGVSVAIAIGNTEVCAAQDLPSSIQSQPTLSTAKIPPAIAKKTLTPERLNPSANPLILPLKPDQVQIRRVEPITLQQAQNLARRNNRDLQTTLFNLERSRALLQEAQSSQYPTVNGGAGLTRMNLLRN